MLDPQWWELQSLLREMNFLYLYEVLVLITVVLVSLHVYPMLAPSLEQQYKTDLQRAWKHLCFLVDTTHCAPILLRLAWSDAVGYDNDIDIGQWPLCGGVNGSIRREIELSHNANAGLRKALTLLQPIKKRFRTLRYLPLTASKQSKQSYIPYTHIYTHRYTDTHIRTHTHIHTHTHTYSHTKK
jgi:hypothetical protein